jgi:hypothetical protein
MINHKCQYGFEVVCGRPAEFFSESIPGGYWSCELHVPMMMVDSYDGDRSMIRIWARKNPELANRFYPGNKFNEALPAAIGGSQRKE